MNCLCFCGWSGELSAFSHLSKTESSLSDFFLQMNFKSNFFTVCGLVWFLKKKKKEKCVC